VLRYTPLPTTPAASRDIALLLPESVSIEKVSVAVRAAAGILLEELTVLDEYRGKELPQGRRSVVLRLLLRGRERTLRDSDVEAVIARVLSTLEQTLDVTLRSA
jgi:phenylalanyl-tRNA synthetase beta chain